MSRWVRLLFLMLAAGLCLAPQNAPAYSQTVNLPIVISYPMLYSTVVEQAFKGPDQRVQVVNLNQGCTMVELWEPELGQENGLVRLGCRIKVRAGITLLGRCIQPVEWEGYLEVLEKALVSRRDWKLSFLTADSRLLGPDRRPTEVVSTVWDLVKTYVHPYFETISLDLAAPLKDLRESLPLLVGPEIRQQMDQWLAEARPSGVEVTPEAVRVNMGLTLELEPVPTGEPEGTPPPLTPEEKERFIEYWQTWDAYLVNQCLVLAGYELTPEERDVILDTLLRVRYSFVEALDNPQGPKDMVRAQFVEAWRALSPIMRRHLLATASPSLFQYLAFLTASDALEVLDGLGPALNLDISQEGLLRLAQMVAGGGPETSLVYDWGVNERLRGLLGLEKDLPPPGMVPPDEGLPLPTPEAVGPEGPYTWLRELLAAAPAWAAEDGMVAKAMAWRPPKRDWQDYFERVMDVVERAAREAGNGLRMPGGEEAFRHLVLAAAWQESCWRQFVEKGGKLVPLRSYNGTSVGVMQINERVWRGVYDLAGLRWDIDYNARAGSDILRLYLERYVLKKLDNGQKDDPDLAASMVYAAYNGGPAQVDAYIKRLKAGKTYRSDRLFEEKYRWVTAGEFQNAGRCLVGN